MESTSDLRQRRCESFAQQFLLSRESTPPVAHFASRELSHGFYLHTADSLPIVEIVHKDRQLGLLLGFPVDLENAIGLGPGARLAIDPRVSRDQMRDHLYERLSGSFIIILDISGNLQLCLDACGTLSLVYDRERQAVASTALLLLGTAYDDAFRPDLFRAFEVASDGWFSAGLTAHDGVERLLVNHCLTLPNFDVQRHWPTVLPDYCEDPESVIREIGTEVGLACRAFADLGEIDFALTGGFETRALLACNSELARHRQFVTVAVPGGERDVVLAQRLAQLARLNHRVLPTKVAGPAEAEEWTRLAGHCLTGMNRLYFPSVDPLAGRILVGGLGGEVGRGFLWPDGLTKDDRISTFELVDLLKLPRHSLLLERVEHWLQDIPEGLDAWQLLDLAYVELRMGTWAFAQAYTNPKKLDLHPLISRRQFRRMWSLPPTFRADGGLMRGLVEQFWPELLQVPVNAYGGWRDKLSVVTRALRRPDRALRKLRQLVRQRIG